MSALWTVAISTGSFKETMNLQYTHTPTKSTSRAILDDKRGNHRDCLVPASNERLDTFTGKHEGDSRGPCTDGRERSPCLQGIDPNITSTQSRYEVLETQRSISTLKSIRECSLMPVFGGDVEVQIRQSGKVGFGGLNSCKCANCLRCASSRSKEHADKIRRIILEAEGRGYKCWFLTSNISSTNNSRQLQKFWNDLLAIWNKTFSPRFNKNNNIVGTVRCFDWTLSKTTFNLNGHFHSIIITKPGWSLTDLKDAIFSRWQKYTFKQTGTPASFKAQDLQQITSTGVADYLVKAFGDETDEFNTLEISSTDKSGNGLWGWSLKGLIEEIARTANKRLIAAYRSIERELKGKQRVSYQGWSKVLLEAAPELPARPDKDPVVELQVVPKPVWWSFRPHRLKILIAFHLDAMAKTYFKLLCERLELGEIMPRDEIDGHLKVFLKAFERDQLDARRANQLHDELFEDLW
jgi:hypothetical protein